MGDKSELVEQAVAAVRRYVVSERDGAVGPDAEQLAALDEFGQVSLDAPIQAGTAIEMLDRIGSPATMRTTGGRYFGFVNGGVTPEALAASLLAAAWDQNAALPVMSPVAAALDQVVAGWIIDLLGLPVDATAAFCPGASVANLTAIVGARDELLGRVGWDVGERGLAGAPRIDVVASTEAHISVDKALRVAGFGSDQVTRVPADANGCLIADRIPVGDAPTLVLAQAGNVNTGHSDPFAAIADRLQGSNTWLHVDGAFGLWAAASPARSHLVAGVERADSWATDAHKWLNAPYDAGLVICRDGAALARSMANDAAYATAGGERSAMNLGLQMSQAARAIPVWAILATHGRAGIAEAVDGCVALAKRAAVALADGGAEVLAPVVLNQALVSFGDDDTTDKVVDRVQAGRVCWVGATTWQGRRAMRFSVSDLSTTAADIDTATASIIDAWRTGEHPAPSSRDEI